MKNPRLRLLVLCEDSLHRSFVERLAERSEIGPRQLTIDPAPRSQGSAAQYVLERFVDFAKKWRSMQHDKNVGGLVVIDGDEKGLAHRRQQLTEKLKQAGQPTLDPEDSRFAILVPCWHIETWIAWLCGHRPIDEQTCYKPNDLQGGEVGRRIRDGLYTTQQAIKAWAPPREGESDHVPSLASARHELRRLGLR